MKRIFEEPIVDIVELRNLDILCTSTPDCSQTNPANEDETDMGGAI